MADEPNPGSALALKRWNKATAAERSAVGRMLVEARRRKRKGRVRARLVKAGRHK